MGRIVERVEAAFEPLQVLRRGWVALVAGVGIFVFAAVGMLPMYGAEDGDTEGTASQRGALVARAIQKAEYFQPHRAVARAVSTDFDLEGPSDAELAPGSTATGRVAWVGPFGVSIGSYELEDGEERWETNPGRMRALWVAFIAGEIFLVAAFTWIAWDMR